MIRSVNAQSFSLRMIAIVLLSSWLLLAGNVFTSVGLGGLFSERASNNSQIGTASASRYGGTLVIGTQHAPTVINPILTKSSISQLVAGLVFDSLLDEDAQSQVIYSLMEGMEVSSDELQYVFHLRKGVRFHDGIELTADDVKFTFEATGNERNRSPLYHSFNSIEGVWEVLDRYTIRLTLPAPDNRIPSKLNGGIAPRHLLENCDMWLAPLNYAPIGTGSYRFKKWDRVRDQIELEANKDYFWGRPFIDNIVIKTFPDNSSLWAAFMRKEVDLVENMNQDDYKLLSSDPAFKAFAMPQGYSSVIVYNMRDPVLADINVRRAIAMSISVDKLMKDIPMSGERFVGPFEKGVLGFNADVHPIPFDPVKARETLMSAGWKFVEGNSILAKDGHPLKIKMLVDGRVEYFQRMAMLIRQQLSEVGIKLEVLLYTTEGELTRSYLELNGVQAWLRFVTTSFGPELIVDQWRKQAGSYGDFWDYSNPAVDELMATAVATKDIGERGRIYQKIHKIMYEDQPGCFFFTPITFWAVSSRVQNVTADYVYNPALAIRNMYFVGNKSR